MELENIIGLAAGLFVASGTVFTYGKKIKTVLSTVEKINSEKTIALNAMNQVKSLIESAKAANADGTITPEEMEKIIDEAEAVLRSPDIEKLLKDFVA